jgi:hypothetical protein
MKAPFSAGFSCEKAGNKSPNNFFAKKACHYHIWGYTSGRLPTKWGLQSAAVVPGGSKIGWIW